MAGGVVGGEMSDDDDGDGSRCCTPNRRHPVVVPPLPLPRELDLLLSKYVLFQMYLLKAVTGLGYLALTWSTVVLLGGFITALTKTDFWCITVISFMQAARIFHDLADQLLPNFFKLVTHIILHNRVVLRHRMSRVTESFRHKDPLPKVASRVASVAFVVLVVLPFLVLSYVPAFLYVYGGPVACIALAVWRAVQRDYGDDGGDSGKTNLAPALDMFYSLVLVQGGLLLVWLYHESWWVDHLITLRQHSKLPDTPWCRLALVEFLCDTRARCWRDLSSIRGRRLVDYAAGLLESGLWDDNLSGARLLDKFIRHGHGGGVRSLLLPSRSKIQKLIDSLGWRGGRQRRAGDGEMRRLAARIVAHLAGDLHLAQFPGAIQCISYLLQEEATMAYSEQLRLTHRPQRRLASEKQAMVFRLEKREARRRKKHMTGGQQQEQEVADGGSSRSQGGGGGGGGGGACNELILQGLAILERLTLDHHNCGEICGSPGLLTKITAPLYSGNLLRDIHIITDWVHVANASFKVVYQLIQAPGETSARLRAEISENKQAMSNLDAIVRQEAQHEELKMRGMEILTELALDLSINLTRETKQNLIKMQLRTFLPDVVQREDLADEGDQEPVAMSSSSPLKFTAGMTLARLLTDSEVTAEFIMSLHGNVVGRLTDTLDDKSIHCRVFALKILEHLCAHCALHKQHAKEVLLPKVVTKIMSIKIEDTQTGEENRKNPARGQDEENQYFSTPMRDQKRSSGHGNEEQNATKDMQARLLSLTLAIYDKLISAEDFGDVLQNKDVSPGSFVAKLKAIVEENCKVTIFSLKIVKLCGKIAISMIHRNQYIEQFKNKEFVESLTDASKTMSNLESCMLFAGTEYRQKMTVEPPPLSSLVEVARQLVGR